MTGIRSVALARTQLLATRQFFNTSIPADRTWIFKSISVFNNSTGSISYSINLIYAGPPPVYASIANNATLTAGSIAYKEIWLVGMPGDQLQLYADNGPTYFWLSGASLPQV